MHYNEVSIFGIYIAPFALMMVIAWVIAMPLFQLLERSGLSRHVWHPPLFNFALYAILLSLIVLLAGLV